MLSAGLVVVTGGPAAASSCDGWWTLDGRRYNVQCKWLDADSIKFRAVAVCEKFSDGSLIWRYGAWVFALSPISSATCPLGYDGYIGTWEEKSTY